MNAAKRAFEGDEESEMNAYTTETKAVAKRAKSPQRMNAMMAVESKQFQRIFLDLARARAAVTQQSHLTVTRHSVTNSVFTPIKRVEILRNTTKTTYVSRTKESMVT